MFLRGSSQPRSPNKQRGRHFCSLFGFSVCQVGFSVGGSVLCLLGHGGVHCSHPFFLCSLHPAQAITSLPMSISRERQRRMFLTLLRGGFNIVALHPLDTFSRGAEEFSAQKHSRELLCNISDCRLCSEEFSSLQLWRTQRTGTSHTQASAFLPE